jgi:hypothetical protein
MGGCADTGGGGTVAWAIGGVISAAGVTARGAATIGLAMDAPTAGSSTRGGVAAGAEGGGAAGAAGSATAGLRVVAAGAGTGDGIVVVSRDAE